MAPENGPRTTVVEAARSELESPVSGQRAIPFDDLFERILPSFADQSIAASIRESLEQFAAAQQAGNTARARVALGTVRSLLDRSDVHPANLGVIRFALVQSESLLDPPSASQGTGSNP
jgi:hypothetical protein